jgi:PRC-barrel domain
MPHYGTLQDFAFQKGTDDIRGSTLYGMEEEEDVKLGKIDDVIFDHETGAIEYVVVDSGGWLTHKKFLVPAEQIHGYEHEENAFQTDLTKAHIEQFPRYDESEMKSEKNWADYLGHYNEHWKQNPIQHQQERIDLDVTPAMQAGKGDRRTEEELAREDAEGKFTPTRLQSRYPQAEQSSAKIQMVPAGASAATEEPLPNEYPIVENPPSGPTQHARADVGQWHPRMRKFEDVLKKNRVDVTASCPSCAPGKKAA